MVGTPPPLTLLILPLWLGLPLLLIASAARQRTVRIAFGAGLAAALLFLFAVFCQALQGRGLPTGVETLILWGPTTLVAAGLALLADRSSWMRQRPTKQPPPRGPRRVRIGRMLTAAFIIWSSLSATCVLTPVAKMVDLRLNSPTPGLVLPLPEGLTLIATDRGCGSQECSDTYLIGSPDRATPHELTERLWTHLVADKGWKRLRDDAGCIQPGWVLRPEFCLFIRIEPYGLTDTLIAHVTGAVTAG